jgi:gamma-glutamyltranspeptidase/glutathione hydrolase
MAVSTRPAFGEHGAVVAPNHLATAVGLEVLRGGGNAVDAAIATNAALAVVSAHSCGLGGDAFWLIWPGEGGPWLAESGAPAAETGSSAAESEGRAAESEGRAAESDDGVLGRLIGLNGSGRAGSLATIDRVRGEGHATMPMWSPLSITVPGGVRSWADAHARFGSHALPELLAPAIALADDFPASAGWSTAIERSAARFGTDGGWARVFRPLGRPWREGETVHLAPLAATLRRLAADGSADFYEGALANRQAAFLRDAGALITGADLAGHASTWTRPLGVSYRGALATSHPPNSSGVIALVALAVLERFPPPSGEFDADWIHTAIEVSRLALEDRERELAEPEAMAPDAVDRLLGPNHADQLAGRIDPRRSGIGRPSSIPRGGGTVFLAAADRWGGLVSLIQSNWHGFGSGVVDPETGIAYQDRGVSFSLDPQHPNALGPGKRTAHTLTPGMLFRDGGAWVAHGSMGGEVQPQIYVQVVSALVDRRTDVASALSGPRWGLQTRSILEPPEHLLLESRFPNALVADLAGRGHPIELLEPFDSAVGHCHAIEVRRRANGSIEGFAAATDPRSEGKPAVF